MGATTTLTVTAVGKHIMYAMAFLIGSVGMSVESFAILGVIVVVDTFTGVVRTIILHGGRSFTSTKLMSGIVSKAFIVSVPLLVVWSGKGAGIDMMGLGKGILSVLIFSELYSTLGNIYAIHIRKDVKEFDAVAFLLHKVRDIVENILKNSTKIDPPKGE